MNKSISAIIIIILCYVLSISALPLVPLSAEPISENSALSSRGSNENWSTDVRLTNDLNDSWFPDIAIDLKNNIHIVWCDMRDEVAEVYYKKYEGASWSEDYRLDYDENGHSGNPSITIDSQDNLHVVFADNRRIDNNDEIYYTKYDGTSWSTPQRITFNSGYSVAWSPQLGPKIICDSKDNFYVFWAGYKNYNVPNDRDIFYVKYDGISWSTIYDVTNDNRPNYDHVHPIVAVDSTDHIHMAYTSIEDGYYMIHYTQFDGTEWNEPIKISENNGGLATLPSIDIDSEDNIHIVWTDGRDFPSGTQNEIYYTKLDNNGNTIIDDIRLTFDNVDSGFSYIKGDYQDLLNVVWLNGYYENSTVWHTWIDYNGNKIIENINIGNASIPNADRLSPPRLSIDSNNKVHLVFADDRDSNLEIYYKKSLYKLNHRPKVTITLPVPNQELSEEITIIGSASDIDTEDTIIKVELSISNASWNSGWKLVAGTTSWSYQWDTTQVSNGEYTIYARSYDGELYSYETTVIVNVKNIYNRPPTCAIIEPQSGKIIEGVYTIIGKSSDPEGNDTIIKVEIKFSNDTWKSTWKTTTGIESWTYNWDTTKVSNGEYNIYARAFDGKLYSLNSTVSVTINNKIENTKPICTIIQPVRDEIIEGIYTIEGSASDPDKDDTIVEVQIKIDNDKWIKAIGTNDWSYSWDTIKVLNDKHTIYAQSYDGELYSNEVSVEIIVNNPTPENNKPYLEITYPKDDEILKGEYTIRGTSSDPDPDDKVTKVEIKITNDTWSSDWIIVDSTESWSYDWNTKEVTDSRYIIHARAHDGELYSDTSIVTITVDNSVENIKPTCTITHPKDMDTINQIYTIKGTATDPDGIIQSVELRSDNDLEWVEVNLINNEWSYEWNTSQVENGEHTINTRAYDGTDYSDVDSVTIIVNNDNPNGSDDGTNNDLLLGFGFIFIIIILVATLTFVWIFVLHKKS